MGLQDRKKALVAGAILVLNACGGWLRPASSVTPGVDETAPPPPASATLNTLPARERPENLRSRPDLDMKKLCTPEYREIADTYAEHSFEPPAKHWKIAPVGQDTVVLYHFSTDTALEKHYPAAEARESRIATLHEAFFEAVSTMEHSARVAFLHEESPEGQQHLAAHPDANRIHLVISGLEDRARARTYPAENLVVVYAPSLEVQWNSHYSTFDDTRGIRTTLTHEFIHLFGRVEGHATDFLPDEAGKHEAKGFDGKLYTSYSFSNELNPHNTTLLQSGSSVPLDGYPDIDMCYFANKVFGARDGTALPADNRSWEERERTRAIPLQQEAKR